MGDYRMVPEDLWERMVRESAECAAELAALRRVVRLLLPQGSPAAIRDAAYRLADGGCALFVGQETYARDTLAECLRAAGDEAGAAAVEAALRGAR